MLVRRFEAPLTLLAATLVACAAPPVQTDAVPLTHPPRTEVEERGLPVVAYALVRDHVLPPRAERGPELGGVAPIAPRPDEKAAAGPWSERCPDDGLILTVVARTLPAELGPDSAVSSLCLFDRVWCTRDEARALVPAEPRVGDTYALPSGFTARLARFALVDREGGAGAAFAADDVAGSELVAELLSMHDSVLRLSLTGTLVAEDGERRIASEVRGTAAWDYELSSFTSFELVADALGTKQGGPRRRVGFVLTLSRSPHPELLPPRLIELYEPYGPDAGTVGTSGT